MNGGESSVATAAPVVPAPRGADQLLGWADRWRRWLAGAVLLLYLGSFNGQWHIEPDGALYLSIARNLAEGRGYTYHGEPHHLAYPGLPYLLAGTFQLFGPENLWPAHVLILLSALLTLGLTYRLLSLHTDRPTAVLVTALLAFSALFHRYALHLRNDMPFLLGVVAFFAGYEALRARRAKLFDWLLLLSGIALALVMRPAVWALLLAVALDAGAALLTRSGARRAALISLVVLLIAAAFWVMDPRRIGQRWTGDYEGDTVEQLTNRPAQTLRRIVTVNLPKLMEPVAAEALFGHEIGPGLNSLAGAAILTLGVLLLRRRSLWGLFVAATVVMILVVPAPPLDRYFLPVLPLLIYAWWLAVAWLSRRLARPWDWIAVILFAGVVTLNGIKVIETFVDQYRRPFLAHYKEGRYESVAALAEQIRRHVEPSGRVLVQRKGGRILSYLSDRVVLDARDDAYFADAPLQPTYVVLPADADLQSLLEQRQWELADALATVPRRRQPPWQLHAVRAPAQ